MYPYLFYTHNIREVTTLMGVNFPQEFWNFPNWHLAIHSVYGGANTWIFFALLLIDNYNFLNKLLMLLLSVG
jgi:hypothetical protein